jgi:hypothetical protein
MYRRRKRGELRGSSKPSQGSCNYGRGMIDRRWKL